MIAGSKHSLKSLLSVLVLCPAVAACDRPAPQALPPDVTVRDSAGIEIIENHAPVWDSAEFWTVDPEPVFVLGGHSGTSETTDASHLVWSVEAAAQLSDGRVVVLSSAGEKKVLVFEPLGHLSRSFARSGRGPGEFNYPVDLQVLPGDTIVVWDVMYGPVGYFDSSGTLLRHRSLDLGAVMEVARTAEYESGESMRLPLPDGSFLVTVWRRDWQMPRDGTLYRQPVAYFRFDSAAHHSFGWWDGMELLSPHTPGPPNLPFPAMSGVAAGGRPMSVFITNGDRFEVHQFSPVGELRRLIRRKFDPIPITSEDIEGWKDVAIVGHQMVDQDDWERMMAALPRRYHPPIGTGGPGLRVDAEGHLWAMGSGNPFWGWVRDKPTPGTGTRKWSVFDSEGRWLGTTTMPVNRVLWIGIDVVIGHRFHPDTGVETVEGYRLNRRTGPR